MGWRLQIAGPFHFVPELTLTVVSFAGLAAADKMDYLEDIVWLDLSLAPGGAREDVEVMFDGYPVTAHFKKIQQRGYRGTFGNFAGVTIYFYEHGRLWRGGGR